MPEYQSRYNHYPVRRLIEGDSLTKQAFKDECDINNILKKYVRSGAIDHFAAHGANYGFATSQDFHSAMNTITAAQQMFDDLPSALRKRFANNPENFLDFVQDPANTDELVELGLADVPVPGWAPHGPSDPDRGQGRPGVDPPPGPPAADPPLGGSEEGGVT